MSHMFSHVKLGKDFHTNSLFFHNLDFLLKELLEIDFK